MSDSRVTYKVLMEAQEKSRLEMKNDLSEIKKEIEKLSENIACNFVSKKEFAPIKEDVASLQSNWRYIVLTISTILIGSVMALIVK